VIDTEVEGDPAAVTAAATWLRDTLAVKVADAADHTQSARNTARGSWEGESASSYQAMTHEVVDKADKHEARVTVCSAGREITLRALVTREGSATLIGQWSESKPAAHFAGMLGRENLN